MNIVLFGATGMIGQGVLRECLRDPDVQLVQTVGRAPTGRQNPKLKEVIRKDLFDYAEIESQLRGFHACFFCLGVSSFGMSEADYTRITHDIALAAAESLVRMNQQMTFVFVSGGALTAANVAA